MRNCDNEGAGRATLGLRPSPRPPSRWRAWVLAVLFGAGLAGAAQADPISEWAHRICMPIMLQGADPVDIKHVRQGAREVTTSGGRTLTVVTWEVPDIGLVYEVGQNKSQPVFCQLQHRTKPESTLEHFRDEIGGTWSEICEKTLDNRQFRAASVALEGRSDLVVLFRHMHFRDRGVSRLIVALTRPDLAAAPCERVSALPGQNSRKVI